MNKFVKALMQAQNAPKMSMPTIPSIEPATTKAGKHRNLIPLFALGGTALLATAIVVPVVCLNGNNPNRILKNATIKARLTPTSISEGADLLPVMKDALYKEASTYSPIREGVFSPVSSFLSKSAYLLSSTDADQIASKMGFGDGEFSKEVKNLRAALYRDGSKSFIRNGLAIGAFNLPIKNGAVSSFVEKENITFLSSDLDAGKEAIEEILSEECKEAITIPDSSIGDSSINCFSAISMQDGFTNAKNTVRGLFNGETATQASYMEDLVYTGYLDSDNGFSAAEYRINETSIAFFLPDGDTNVEQLDLTSAISEWMLHKGEKARVHITMPLFEVEETREIPGSELEELAIQHPYDLICPEYASNSNWISKMSSKTKFRLDATGAYGSSLSIISSTITSAIGQNDAIEFNVNRPFIFLSTYKDIPLFIGTVKSANI